MFSFKKSLGVFFGLLLVIATLSLILPLVGRGQGGGVNPLKRDTRKSFYVTETTHNGSQALTACAEGYHMASVWEILDPSNLRYNTQLGATWPDSGFGPPTASASEAWIRTGGPASNSETIGLGNCNAWTSASQDDFGTLVRLDFPWDAAGEKVSPWDVFTTTCVAPAHVWCVQD